MSNDKSLVTISYYWHSYRAFTHLQMIWVQWFSFSSVCMCCTWIGSPSPTGSVNINSAFDPLLSESAEMLSWGSLTSCQCSSFPESPSMLPPNKSKRFQWTTLTLPPPVTRAILKTGNPLYGCPSTWYIVSFQWSWVLCLHLILWS